MASALVVVTFVKLLLQGHMAVQDQFVLPDDLKDLCPYTSFCNVTSQRSRADRSFRPCCGGCSCDSECGKTRNCCTYEMDTYRLDEKDSSSCRKAAINHGPNYPQDIVSYRMIDTCPNGDKCYTDEANSSHIMFPHSSLNDGLIYINKACCECHNTKGLLPWSIGYVCSMQNLIGHITDLTSGVNNLIYSNYQDQSCTVHYIPPTVVDVTTHECFPETSIINTCLSNGEIDISSNYETECMSFNATYRIEAQNKYFVFANIYCALCNNVTLKKDCNVDTDPVKTSTGSILLLLDSSDPNGDLDLENKEYCAEVTSFYYNSV